MGWELWHLDATDLTRLIRLGHASAHEAAENCISRLRAVNPENKTVAETFGAAKHSWMRARHV